MRRLFPDHNFVSLDLPTEAEQAEKEPEGFLRRHAPPVIVDEVQYAPALFRHLKVAVDAHRSRHGQYLLTGSPKFSLMKNVADSLAGRADILELETLSFAEILAARTGTKLESAITAYSSGATEPAKSISSPTPQDDWNFSKPNGPKPPTRERL